MKHSSMIIMRNYAELCGSIQDGNGLYLVGQSLSFIPSICITFQNNFLIMSIIDIIRPRVACNPLTDYIYRITRAPPLHPVTPTYLITMLLLCQLALFLLVVIAQSLGNKYDYNYCVNKSHSLIVCILQNLGVIHAI